MHNILKTKRLWQIRDIVPGLAEICVRSHLGFLAPGYDDRSARNLGLTRVPTAGARKPMPIESYPTVPSLCLDKRGAVDVQDLRSASSSAIAAHWTPDSGGTLPGSHVEGRLSTVERGRLPGRSAHDSSGHLWPKRRAAGYGRQRLGVGRLCGSDRRACGGVSRETSPDRLAERGNCQIDLGLGTLSVRAPLHGAVSGRKPIAPSQPGLLVTAALRGWLDPGIPSARRPPSSVGS